MTNESHNANPQKTKPRRWFRFRLRTLLILLTLISVPLGWIGWELGQRRREKATIAWIEEMGGRFDFHSEVGSERRSWWEKTKAKWFGERVQFVVLDATIVSDLSPLAELKNLRGLFLDDTQVSDLLPLAELKNLRSLILNATQVSDLSALAELKNLESLYLNATQVGDLSPLAELKNLEWLNLNATPVSDLSPLGELKNLEYLDLNHTQVSDLSPLAELKNLERLYGRLTQVSEEQLENLRQALPNCEIYFGPTDR